MYSITLKDGTMLTNLEANGDYFVSTEPVDVAVFRKENMKGVVIYNGETTESTTIADAVLVHYTIIKGSTFFDIREKSEAEKEREMLADVTTAASIAFVTMAEGGAIDEITATEHISMFAPWVSGVAYPVGALRTYNDVLYKCVQAHTSQADWTPDVTAALWSKAGDPLEEYPAWSQPVGAHDAYAAGDKVSHNEAKWTSDVDGNVWEPGVYGWTKEGD